jgi:hypothetical protein
MQIELQLTKIGAVERISLKAHGLRSVANSSASVFFRVFPWLILLLLPFSVANSSDFRVFPWLILLLLPFSVANSSASPTVAYASGSVFRVIPWLILLLRQPSLTLPALFSVFFRVIPWQKCLFFFLFSVALLLLRTYQ